jgi:catechol 2,3-dioxygenase-like lactoylglutathione lyase family enzyme
MLHCLDHVILAVDDLEAATRDYTRLLGRRPAWRGEHPSAGSANTLFNLENTYLELLAPAGPGPVGDLLRARIAEEGEGPVGLAFGTDDADACHTEWTKHGLHPGPPEQGLGRDVDSGAYREWRRVPLPLNETRGVVVFGIEHTSPPEILPPSGPIGAEPATAFGLDHAVVQTSEPDAAIALYGTALGLRLALDKSFPQWGMRLLFFRVAGLTVEIAVPLEPAEPLASDRLWGLTWRVRDIEAASHRLAEAGIEVSAVREGRKPGTRVCSVKSGTRGVPTLLIEPAA